MSYSQNKDIITQISETIASENKNFYSEQINTKLGKKYADLIQTTDLPFIDRYGRATFFFIQLDDIQIPFYQPGTFTFESAINSEASDIIVCHNGCQQNGPILGMGCSLFLARFMATLSQNYQRMAASNSDGTFSFEIYKIALLATLSALAGEDATQHGRLLEIREWLLNFCQQKVTLEAYEEVFFYLKELQQSGKIKDFSENEINNAKFAITPEELKKLQNIKKQGRVYVGFDKFFRDHSNQSLFHSQQFQDLKGFILAKKGIFQDQEASEQRLSEFLEKVKESRTFLVAGNKSNVLKNRPLTFSNCNGLESQHSLQEQNNNSSSNNNNVGFPVSNLTIPDDFLRLPNIPKYLVRGVQEGDREYVNRVGNFLTVLGQSELVYVLCQIDPSRQDMVEFLKLTSYVLDRVVQKQ